MIKRSRFLWLVIESMAFLYLVHGYSVEFDYQTSTKPDLYVGEDLTLTCTVSQLTDVGDIFIRYSDGSSTKKSGCANVGDNSWARFIALHKALNLNGPTEDECRAAGSWSQRDGYFAVTVGGVISEKIAAGTTLYCTSTQELSTVTIASSTNLTVSTLKEAPKNLTLMVHSETVVEGTEFSYTCSSTSASPVSEYSYEVLRGNEVVSTTNSYTPTPKDRDGLTLKCNDTEHSRWIIASDIKHSEQIRPYYTAVEGQSIHNDTRDPLLRHQLNCAVASYPSVISYEWRRNGDLITNIESEYVIPAGSGKIGKVETFTCTAHGHTAVEPVTVRWIIQWSNEPAPAAIGTPVSDAAAAEGPMSVNTSSMSSDKIITISVIGSLLAVVAVFGTIFGVKKCKQNSADYQPANV